jgi:hypothetical protein
MVWTMPTCLCFQGAHGGWARKKSRSQTGSFLLFFRAWTPLGRFVRPLCQASLSGLFWGRSEGALDAGAEVSPCRLVGVADVAQDALHAEVLSVRTECGEELGGVGAVVVQLAGVVEDVGVLAAVERDDARRGCVGLELPVRGGGG